MKIFLIFLVSADNVCWRSFIDTCRCNTDFTGCALSYPILSYTIQSYPILSYTILSYPILSYPILSYPILSPLLRNAVVKMVCYIHSSTSCSTFSLTPLLFFNSVFSLTISHLSVDKVTAPLGHIDDGLTKD